MALALPALLARLLRLELGLLRAELLRFAALPAERDDPLLEREPLLRLRVDAAVLERAAVFGRERAAVFGRAAVFERGAVFGRAEPLRDEPPPEPLLLFALPELGLLAMDFPSPNRRLLLPASRLPAKWAV